MLILERNAGAIQLKWLSIGILLSVVIGCSRRPGEVPGASVLLIGIDTLRADHLGCYGYHRPTSPRIDALAREGVVFVNAISQSPWTLPAFASMFTGLLPSSHRAGEGNLWNVSRLEPERHTLATVLRSAGYRTASVVSNGFVSRDAGMVQGFDDHQLSIIPELTIDAAVRWLETHGRKRFFLFVHIVDPHQPYAPPAEHAAPFVDPAYAGPVGMSYAGAGDPGWPDADRRRVIDLYDGEVRYADSHVGRVLDTLAKVGAADRTLVIVTADHGEELFERGMLGHGHTLYDELLRVPLVIRWPAGKPQGRIKRQVRLMDVFPTVLNALALPVPANLDGLSLLPLVRREPPAPESGVAIAEYLFTEPEQKAVRWKGHKLILTPSTGDTTLFNVRSDPVERNDVHRKRPLRAAKLRAPIERRMAETLEGFHLVAGGGVAAHRLRAELRAPQGFVDVALYKREEGDRYTLSADGRTLDVELALAARAHLPLAELDIYDDDRISFRTVGDAAVDVRLFLDEAPLLSGAFSLGADGKGPPAEWRFAPLDERLVVPFPQALIPAEDGSPRVALVYVHRPAAPLADLSDRTRESLRALGYIDD